MSKTQIPTGGIADDAISEEHIDATVITGSTALAATPADTDELLISDAGTIKRIDFSHMKSVAGSEAFLVKESSTQTVSDDTYTQVSFTSEDFDVGSNFASSTFTAPSDGKYFFFANVTIAGTSAHTGSHYVSLFYKNGSAVDYLRSVYQDNANETIMAQMHITGALDLSATDTVKVYAKGNINSNTARFIDKAFGGFKLA